VCLLGCEYASVYLYVSVYLSVCVSECVYQEESEGCWVQGLVEERGCVCVCVSRAEEQEERGVRMELCRRVRNVDGDKYADRWTSGGQVNQDEAKEDGQGWG